MTDWCGAQHRRDNSISGSQQAPHVLYLYANHHCQSSAGRHDAGDGRFVHSLVSPRVVKLILVLFVWKPYYQISF